MRDGTAHRFALVDKNLPQFCSDSGLDKIYYRGSLTLHYVHRSRLELARVASDHLPVIADFELSAC